MDEVGTFIDLGRGAGPIAIAEAQFFSKVAEQALTKRQMATGFVSASIRTNATPEEVLSGWENRGDWRVSYAHARVAEMSQRLALVTAMPSDGSLDIQVFSPRGEKDAQATLTALLARCPAVPEPEKGIEARFWFNTSMGPSSHVRTIEAPEWDEVAGNYPPTLRSQIADLTAWQVAPGGTGGKLLLMHGPPGTGKTWVLRT